MELTQKKIDRIMKKYADIFEMLENYDKTRKLPFQRKRIDITLPNSVIDKLKEKSLLSGKPISRIIEDKFT